MKCVVMSCVDCALTEETNNGHQQFIWQGPKGECHAVASRFLLC
jgi:hypothetical protein